MSDDEDQNTKAVERVWAVLSKHGDNRGGEVSASVDRALRETGEALEHSGRTVALLRQRIRELEAGDV